MSHLLRLRCPIFRPSSFAVTHGATGGVPSQTHSRFDEALRQKLEFVLEENRVYRALLDRHSPHWRLQDSERKTLAEKGKPLGKFLAEVIMSLFNNCDVFQFPSSSSFAILPEHCEQEHHYQRLVALIKVVQFQNRRMSK